MRANVLVFVMSGGLVALSVGQPSAQVPTVPTVPVTTTQDVQTAQLPPAPPAPPARQLELTFHGDGTVTLLAQSVSLREILNEWSRKGGSVMQGSEKLTGGPSPTPLRFTKQPESVVLNSLLGTAAGVLLGARLEGSPGPSRVDVWILATSSATAMYGGSPMTQPSSPMPTGGFPNNELPPVPGVQPQPGPGPQQQAPPPPSRPGNAVTVTPVNPVTVTPVGPGTTTTGRGGGGGGR
jgi:hypothetical protein